MLSFNFTLEYQVYIQARDLQIERAVTEVSISHWILEKLALGRFKNPLHPLVQKLHAQILVKVSHSAGNTNYLKRLVPGELFWFCPSLLPRTEKTSATCAVFYFLGNDLPKQQADGIYTDRDLPLRGEVWGWCLCRQRIKKCSLQEDSLCSSLPGSEDTLYHGK